MNAWIVRLPGEKSTEINHMQPSSSALLKDLNLLQNSFHISPTRFYFKITWLFHSLWHFSFLATTTTMEIMMMMMILSIIWNREEFKAQNYAKKALFVCALRLECIDLITKTHDFVCVMTQKTHEMEKQFFYSSSRWQKKSGSD